MNARARLGVIGAGYLTRAALRPALERPDSPFRLAAVLDPDPGALAALGVGAEVELTGDPEVFFAARLDAVHVAPPNAEHAPLALRALDQGLATLVDKPLADTVEAGRAILAKAEAAAAAGGVAMIGYMAKLNAWNRLAGELIRAGAIGEPLAMRGTHLGHQSHGWRTRRAASGLGSLGDLAVYPVATASDLLGTDAVSARASAYPAGDAVLTDLHVLGRVEYASGRVLDLESSFTEELGVGSSRYTVIGTDGVLIARETYAMNGGGSVQLADKSGRRYLQATPVDPYHEQYLRLAACMAGEAVPEELSIARGLHDLAVLHALDRSAATGGPISILRGE
jgi:predicted dehydrogenase